MTIISLNVNEKCNLGITEYRETTGEVEAADLHQTQKLFISHSTDAMACERYETDPFTTFL